MRAWYDLRRFWAFNQIWKWGLRYVLYTRGRDPYILIRSTVRMSQTGRHRRPQASVPPKYESGVV